MDDLVGAIQEYIKAQTLGNPSSGPTAPTTGLPPLRASNTPAPSRSSASSGINPGNETPCRELRGRPSQPAPRSQKPLTSPAPAPPESPRRRRNPASAGDQWH